MACLQLTFLFFLLKQLERILWTFATAAEVPAFEAPSGRQWFGNESSWKTDYFQHYYQFQLPVFATGTAIVNKNAASLEASIKCLLLALFPKKNYKKKNLIHILKQFSCFCFKQCDSGIKQFFAKNCCSVNFANPHTKINCG